MKNFFKILVLGAMTLMGLSSCAGNGGNDAEAVLANIHARKSVGSLVYNKVDNLKTQY